MHSSNTYWFNKFLAAFLIFLSFGFSLGLTSGHVQAMRKIDGNLGILSNPLSEGMKWGRALLAKGVDVQALDFVVVVNWAEILNKALKEAAAQLIKSFVSFIMNKFEELIKAFDAFEGVGDALRNSFNSFMAGTAVWANQQVENALGPKSKDTARELLPNASPETQQAFASAWNAAQLNEGISKSQQSVGSPLSINSSAQNKANENALVEAASTPESGNCSEKLYNPSGNSDPLILGKLFSRGPSGCADANAAKARTSFNEQKNQRAAILETQKQRVESQSSECRIGYLKSDPELATQLTNSLNQSSFTSAPNPYTYGLGSTSNSNLSVDSNYTLGNSPSTLALANNVNNAAQAIGLSTTPESLSPQDCSSLQNGKREASLAASQVQGNQSQNEFDFQSIINTFIDAIGKFFTNLITNLLNKAVSAINKFLSGVPGGQYLSNALNDIVGQTNSNIRAAINSIKTSIGYKTAYINDFSYTA